SIGNSPWSGSDVFENRSILSYGKVPENIWSKCMHFNETVPCLRHCMSQRIRIILSSMCWIWIIIIRYSSK
ncbi:MAG: hypothetical protein SO188_15555, partial [Prevotella sp.]|nr:hypothetical protein [Prevotella sp.]